MSKPPPFWVQKVETPRTKSNKIFLEKPKTFPITTKTAPTTKAKA